MQSEKSEMKEFKEVYDEDYFERGIATGKSLYENYRWIPELTIPMTMAIIDYLGIKRGDSVIDFGCAKGFMVKALRMLGRDAMGIDVSRYAISNADPDVRGCCFRRVNGYAPCPELPFDFCIAKDVFEHIEPASLALDLHNITVDCLFVIVPLAENGRYRVPAYEMDSTHINRWSTDEWTVFFTENGWRLTGFEYRIPGIKDNWASFEKGNGFFTLRRAHAIN